MNYVTGKTIRELREKRKFTQKELAERLNLSDKTISKWEQGAFLPDITYLVSINFDLYDPERNVPIFPLGIFLHNLHTSFSLLF